MRTPPVFSASFALLTLVLGGCLEADPDHCANRGGSAACAAADLGDHCSICVASNFGCRATPDPDPTCWADDGVADDAENGAPTPDPENDDPMGDDAPSEPTSCDTEGFDASCPGDTPYCSAGACIGCSVGPVEMCPALDPMAPLCDEGWDRCVACQSAADCHDDTPWCDAATGECRGCAEHAECPGSACDLTSGQCLAPGRALHVDPAACPRTGFGTAGDPYCALSDAVGQLQSGDTIVLAGATEPFEIDGPLPDRIAIVGLGTPALVLGPDASPNGKALLLAGVTVLSDLSCQDGTLALDDARMTGTTTDIEARDCFVRLRRTVVHGMAGTAIAMTGGELALESTVVAANGTDEQTTTAVVLTDTAATVSFSTIAGNAGRTGHAASLRCVGSGTVSMHASAVLAADLSSIDCPDAIVDDSVVDTPGLAGTGTTVISDFDPAWWADLDAGNAHVEPRLDSPLPDAARWRIGAATFDLDGDPIAPELGAPYHAGADQP